MVDIDLIKRCQAREPDAFDRLYKLYATKTLRTAYLIIGHQVAAEDAMQEAFFECYRDLVTLQKPELFRVWFHRLLVRICWRIAAKERKSACENLDKLDDKTIADSLDITDIAEKNQIGHVIKEIIMKLEKTHRATMILYYYNDMTINEIAQIMSCTPGTVKSRLHNGKKKLAHGLKKELGDISDETGYLGKELDRDEKRSTI